MPYKTLELKREYDRKWRAKQWKRKGFKERVTKPLPYDPKYFDIDSVIKTLPNPFGTFVKAKYTCRIKTKVIEFVTTCRNTENCIEIIKQRFKEINDNDLRPALWCTIYKTQKGIRKLIFRKII